MKIVHWASDSASEYNSSHWRGLVQIAALRRAGHNVAMLHVDDWFKQTPRAKALVSLADLVIIERVLVEESLDHCKYWASKGKPIVCDIDDAYQLLKESAVSGNQASKFWYDGKVDVHMPGKVNYEKLLDRHPMEQFLDGCRVIRGLTMPSRVLAEDWAWVTKCWYIPNYIDSERYLKARELPKPKSDDLIIGYGGSMSHLPSFRDSGILEALRRVFQKRRKVKFLLAGDERVMPLLPIPNDKKIYQPYVTWQDWPAVLRRFDILVAPLSGRYDQSRSWIQAIEGNIMGIPFVATGGEPYREWIDAGIGSYITDGDEADLPRRIDEWEAKLLAMIDNYDSEREAMESRLDFAMQFEVNRNVDNILSIYREIIS